MFPALLAQAQQSGFSELIERLARTSIPSILLFSLACTVIRGGIYAYLAANPHARHGFGRILVLIQELADACIYASILVFLIVRPFFVQTFQIPTPSMVDTLKVGDVLLVDKFTYRFRREPQRGDIVVFKPSDFVLHENGNPPGTDYVKRLVGQPGDIVTIESGVLKINGEVQPEPYVRLYKDEGNYFPTDRDRVDYSIVTDFKLVQRGDQMIPLVIVTDPRSIQGGDQGTPPVIDPRGQINLRSAQPFQLPADELAELWTHKPAAIPPGHYLMLGDNRNNSNDGRFWGLISRDQVVGRVWFRVLPVGRFGRADR